MLKSFALKPVSYTVVECAQGPKSECLLNEGHKVDGFLLSRIMLCRF